MVPKTSSVALASEVGEARRRAHFGADRLGNPLTRSVRGRRSRRRSSPGRCRHGARSRKVTVLLGAVRGITFRPEPPGVGGRDVLQVERAEHTGLGGLAG